MKSCSFFLLLILVSHTLSAATYNTVSDGPWDSADTWESGDIPPSNGANWNSNIININHRVVISSSVTFSGDPTFNIDSLLIINGDLNFNQGTIKTGSKGVLNIFGDFNLKGANVVWNGVANITGTTFVNNYTPFRIGPTGAFRTTSFTGTGGPNMIVDGILDVSKGTLDISNSTSIVGSGNVGWGNLVTGGGITISCGSSQSYSAEPGNYPPANPLDLTTCEGGTLPVEFLGLYLSEEPGGVRVTWKTASEKNSSTFEIQRSNNGVDFITVGEVQAAGSSQDVLTYDFFDTQVWQKDNYYRIKENSLEGGYSYSNLAYISIDVLNAAAVYPNPVSAGGVITLNIPAKEGLSYRLVDPAGKSILQKDVKDQGVVTIRLDPGLKSGVYFLRVYSTEGVVNEKIIVQ